MEITEEELNKKIAEAQAEAKKGLLTQDDFDKALSKRINELTEKHKKDLEEKEKTLKMTAEEKQKHDFEVLTKERDELKSSLEAKEHKEKLMSLMSEKKVDNSFYDMFSNVTDLDKASQMMDKLNAGVKTLVDTEVEKKLKPNIPSSGGNETDDAQLRKAMGL